MTDAASGVQPATPGTYGEQPRGWRLPAGTRIGPVLLQIALLERSLGFYTGVLGLNVLQRQSGRASLGPSGSDTVLIELVESPRARPAGQPAHLGLYHFAILLPDRASLARFVRHLTEIGVRAGAGDHLVSEAFYLRDPDGLGIEIYADRPRDTWRRVGRELIMSTDPVDVQGLLAAAGAALWTGMPAGTVMGHVHLHVGDLRQASAFYSDALGFDRTVWNYPGALFFGAGGYHHHVGTNTWAGSHASRPEEGDAQLLEWTIELPDAASVAGAARSLTGTGYAVESQRAADIVTADPWGTSVRIRADLISSPRESH